MFALVISAYAEVAVVDAVSTQQAAAIQAQKTSNQVNAELMYQLQLLQEEVMKMRGMLEEQQHELRVLKQQRLDDYVNLDKRLSEMGQQSSVASTSAASEDLDTDSDIPASSPLLAKKDEDKKEFNAAYELVKQRQLDEAKVAFASFLKKYPAGKYSPNAYYWSGALYFIDGDFPKAKTYFEKLVTDYKDHSKYPESLYKLAEINYELGNRDKAKAQLEELIDKHSETSVNTVRKARSFLQKHYL